MPTAFGPGSWDFTGTKESLGVSTGPQPNCPQPSSFWCPVGVLGLWPPTAVLFLLASCGPQQGSPRGPFGGCETCCPLVAGLFPCCGGASQAEPTWAVPSAGLRARGSLPVPDKGYSVQGWVLSPRPCTCWQLSALGLFRLLMGTCLPGAHHPAYGGASLGLSPPPHPSSGSRSPRLGSGSSS